MMKISRYNYFLPWSGHFIAYNARSGGMAVMNEETHARYTALATKIESGDADGLTPEEESLVQQLRHGSFVRSGEVDEVDELHFWHNMARFDRTALSLSIAPTMACNMACRYCYEANKAGVMSDDVIEKTIRFVAEQAAGLRQLVVNWFGGEPLLAMNVIEKLGRSFISLQREHKFAFDSMIVTNGYLLTRERVDTLCELGVRTAQITLDGPDSAHDAKRPLKNGGKSFRTIVDNMTYAADRIAISVRVNVDKDTRTETIGELLTELDQAGLRQKVGINFGHVEPLSSVCADIADACYNVAEFSRIEAKFFRLLLERGFLVGRLPLPLPIICIAQHVNAYLVDPQGRLYKCFAQLGDPSKAIGQIGEPVRFDNRNFASLFGFDPYTDDECRQCSLLPVCSGGCPEKRTHPDLAKSELCSSWKYNLTPMVDIIAHSRLNLDGTVKGR